MKNTLKLMRRFVGILLLSSFLIIMLNIIILITTAVIYAGNPNGQNGTWSFAEETANAVSLQNGVYSLADEQEQKLAGDNAWAVFIDNATLQVVWHSENLPAEIPLSYTAGEISAITRGYLKDYPTATSTDKDNRGLMVIGFPKDMYWKHMNPIWDYDFIKNSPVMVLGVLAVNAALIMIIYVTANSRLLRSVKPIANGIAELPSGKPVFIREKGLLSELAAKINKTSDILQSQKAVLKKRDRARADWISGVSHDIRTPLSMVMGYAGQLEEDANLTAESRKKAGTIRQQSIRMKNLINDLNLASKLEYNMQPLNLAPVSLVAAARSCVVDFINSDADGRYCVEWNTPDDLTACIINGDEALIRRAVNNILTNSQTHNPNGCTIMAQVRADSGGYKITVEDDGKGVSEEKLNEIRSTPHYMMSDGSISEPRHGLGLLIVRSIAFAHGGSVEFSHGKDGRGFAVTLIFPNDSNKAQSTADASAQNH